MNENFQCQMQWAKEVSEKEAELYGVDVESESNLMPSGKKEKKGEPKECTLALSYKHLTQMMHEKNEEMFETLI